MPPGSNASVTQSAPQTKCLDPNLLWSSKVCVKMHRRFIPRVEKCIAHEDENATQNDIQNFKTRISRCLRPYTAIEKNRTLKNVEKYSNDNIVISTSSTTEKNWLFVRPKKLRVKRELVHNSLRTSFRARWYLNSCALTVHFKFRF